MYQVPVQPKINTKITQTPEKINQSYLGKRSHRSVPTAESEPRIVQQGEERRRRRRQNRSRVQEDARESRVSVFLV